MAPALDDNIFLVCEFDLNFKEKEINKIIKLLADLFEELYSIDDIKNWNGDISFFYKYRDKVLLYFKMYDL
ncbi:MAG: hypothetical protein KGD63_05890 [Candidatus Lokiarchaeota archaeon]|nr:hypothetical protein [Candidatus Lokiarchaeota archaeon]